MHDIFANLPDLLIARAKDVDNLILIHGDPNPGNIMVLRECIRPN